MKVILLTEAEAKPLLDLSSTWREEQQKEINAGVARHKTELEFEAQLKSLADDKCDTCRNEGRKHVGARLSECGRYLILHT